MTDSSRNFKTFKGMYSRVKVVPADFYTTISDAQLNEVVVGISKYAEIEIKRKD